LPALQSKISIIHFSFSFSFSFSFCPSFWVEFDFLFFHRRMSSKFLLIGKQNSGPE
jgi:hypothetical protein